MREPEVPVAVRAAVAPAGDVIEARVLGFDGLKAEPAEPAVPFGDPMSLRPGRPPAAAVERRGHEAPAVARVHRLRGTRQPVAVDPQRVPDVLERVLRDRLHLGDRSRHGRGHVLRADVSVERR